MESRRYPVLRCFLRIGAIGDNTNLFRYQQTINLRHLHSYQHGHGQESYLFLPYIKFPVQLVAHRSVFSAELERHYALWRCRSAEPATPSNWQLRDHEGTSRA